MKKETIEEVKKIAMDLIDILIIVLAAIGSWTILGAIIVNCNLPGVIYRTIVMVMLVGVPSVAGWKLSNIIK